MKLGPKLEHEHTPEAIATRLRDEPRPGYLRDWIYGGIDGAVTTFAVVCGSAGAQLSAKTVLILGFANLFADGFSMAAGNFLGTRSEVEERKRIAAYEQEQIQNEPVGEREEIRQILRKKGFEGDLLERAVVLLTADPDRWLKTMLSEEYGLSASARSPWRAALCTFSAFLACGLIPLGPFLLTAADPTIWALAMTMVVFFLIGSMKSRWSLNSWWSSGLTTLGIGSSAAAIAYGIGLALGRTT